MQVELHAKLRDGWRSEQAIAPQTATGSPSPGWQRGPMRPPTGAKQSPPAHRRSNSGVDLGKTVFIFRIFHLCNGCSIKRFL